jgi:hypothetical protein
MVRVNYRPVLSSERALQNYKKTQLSEENFKENVKLVAGPRWAPDTKTDWPTVGCNVTSTSTKRPVPRRVRIPPR